MCLNCLASGEDPGHPDQNITSRRDIILSSAIRRAKRPNMNHPAVIVIVILIVVVVDSTLDPLNTPAQKFVSNATWTISQPTHKRSRIKSLNAILGIRLSLLGRWRWG